MNAVTELKHLLELNSQLTQVIYQGFGAILTNVKLALSKLKRKNNPQCNRKHVGIRRFNVPLFKVTSGDLGRSAAS